MSERPPLPEPLAGTVIDSHCHLDSGRDGEPPLPVEEALELAASVGVSRIVQIGCDLPAARWAVQAADRHPQLVAGVALHPSEIGDFVAAGQLDDALNEIDQLAGSSPRVRAVGETGLDYYWTKPAGHTAQQDAFRAHIELAKRHDKVLVIHDRDAHADILKVLDDAGPPDRVVMHCFSGDVQFARECVRRGFYLSFAGTVTFKNANSLRQALSVVPTSRIMVETDAPYLTPTPHRGRTNASYLLPLTVRYLTQVKEIGESELCSELTTTTESVFGGW
ncbi:TatD family hydrolase [Flindersiella endophytica]